MYKHNKAMLNSMETDKNTVVRDNKPVKWNIVLWAEELLRRF